VFIYIAHLKTANNADQSAEQYTWWREKRKDRKYNL